MSSFNKQGLQIRDSTPYSHLLGKGRALKGVAIAAITVVLLFAVGCDKGTPTDPNTCDGAAPQNLQPQVTPISCDSLTCTASFTVQSAALLARVNWSFPGGSPPESGNVTGTASFPRSSFPMTRDWTLTGCTCRSSDDIDGVTCRSTNGRVTWTSAD